MKRYMPSMLFLSTVMVLGLCANLHSDTQENRMKLSFDSVFPATPYKDVLGSCMQLLGYLDQLCFDHERKELTNAAILHDAFLGKAVQTQGKINHLMSEVKTGHIVVDDNVSYLSSLLDYINKLYNERIDKEQRNVFAERILNDMSQKISRIGEL